MPTQVDDSPRRERYRSFDEHNTVMVEDDCPDPGSPSSSESLAMSDMTPSPTPLNGSSYPGASSSSGSARKRERGGDSTLNSSTSSSSGFLSGCCANMCSISGDAVLFRSEPMTRCQLILQSEAAYNCIAELGELGLVQFVDLNPEISSFQRKFVSEVKRCEEMERKLRYVQRESLRDEIKLDEPESDPPAPNPREMSEIETALNNLEEDLSNVTQNYARLKKNQLELLELKNLLMKTESFLSDGSISIGGNDDESRNLLEAMGLVDDRDTDDAHLIDTRTEESRSMKFNITAGVIARAKLASFERLVWRVCKGNAFIRYTDINIEDYEMNKDAEEDLKNKSVFMVFYQGEQLKTRVKKVCDGYHATIYPCPDLASERRDMMFGVNTRLEDMRTVVKQTEDHRRNMLMNTSPKLKTWFTKVRKIKAIYHCLNLFSFDVTQKALVAECWMPENDIPVIQEALHRGAEASGSSIPPILNSVAYIDETPPTFNRLNKYTAGFQNLVDAYGVNSYREVNPAVYTIATFPFLFAVMFGDAGHGLIVFLAGLWMILQERSLQKTAEKSEIFGIFFGGRYIVTLMGVFSIYTGLIYNDIFSKSFNIFGSHWAYNHNFTAPIKLEESVMLDPGNRAEYKGDPYFMGLDPVWQLATNKITFLNGYKMKISLIFGLVHMLFGLSLSLWNKLIKKLYADIFLEFLPQLIFLVFIFCYLIFMIFFKWVAYGADNATQDTNVFSEHCAPNLLITFINMMLFKNVESDPKLHAICKGYETYMYPGQRMIQMVLVVVGVLMIPIMLFGKPIHTIMGRNARRRNYEAMTDDIMGNGTDNGPSNDTDEVEIRNGANGNSGGGQGEPELAFGEIMIYQGIHTIEYVLGSVSHTASYLRLWALSLAHSQLSEVLWNMVMRIPLTSFGKSYAGAPVLFAIFGFWAACSVSILVVMEGLSAFLHTLRLHWVEFQSKFYKGEGVLFVPFAFKSYLKEAEAADAEVIKGTN